MSKYSKLIEEHNAQVEEEKRFTIGVIDIDKRNHYKIVYEL